MQTCIIHVIRDFRLVSRGDWDAAAPDVKPIYTAVNTATRDAFDEHAGQWQQRYPADFSL